MATIPTDYLHRVYAGVLGKIFGVLVGRPFENWTYQQILDRLGPIHYYVHEKFGLPCVVIDDDISGTFTFVRALEEHGLDITPADVGHTWLNNVIEKKSVFWWGGNGISTEHTAYLNLKKGILAPESGSIGRNGLTVAEQIGAQIFIDGFGLVSPGNPSQAARLAEAAAKVSHDGEAVYAAKLWAVMEAEAFVSSDIDHLLDTGLSYIPAESAIARLIADIRNWTKSDNDWQKTRERIEGKHGYDKYSGICHVMPNHGIMVMALLYGGHDFDLAMHIINTCGWDTDCNSGNLGCLVGIILGLDAFDKADDASPASALTNGHKTARKLDWRGPVADRVLISSADAGYSINNAARITYDVANLGARLAGQKPFVVPEEQFHFSLPHSVQGFQLRGQSEERAQLRWAQSGGHSGLLISILHSDQGPDVVDVATDTFTPNDVLKVSRHYDLSASPLVYPGQTVAAKIKATNFQSPVDVCIRIKVYDINNELQVFDSEFTKVQPLEETQLSWTIPTTVQNMPIQQVGIAISAPSSPGPTTDLWLNSLAWTGTPRMTLERPAALSGGTEHSSSELSFWENSWVSSVDKFHSNMGPSFYLAHSRGEGIISHGTREWTDYKLTAHHFMINLGGPAGVAIRVRGLNRWYALTFVKGGKLALVKARDEQRTQLVTAQFDWKLDTKYEVGLQVDGPNIKCHVDGIELTARDEEYTSGGIGLVVTEGSISTERIDISPV